VGQNHLALVASRLQQRVRARPRLAYVGGTGDANLGDEAILEALRDLLAPSDLVSLSYPRTERRLSRLGLSGRALFPAMLLSGGTLINPHFEPRVRYAVDSGIATWSFGTGVGGTGFGMRDEDAHLDSWMPLLRSFHGLTVRGPRSAARLRAMGLHAVEVLGDPALFLTPRMAPARVHPPRIALNVARPDGGAGASDYDALERELIAALRPLVAAGWGVTPIAMHRADVLPTTRVVRGLGVTTSVIVADSADAFFGLCSPCTVTVGVRLHAAVLSCCAAVPPVLIGYRDKCADFMESINRGDLLVPFPVDGAILRSVLERVIERGEDVERAIDIEVRAARRRIRLYAARVLEATLPR
jgi:polysaccharide pyruvyl transferase WcaK-like protein